MLLNDRAGDYSAMGLDNSFLVRKPFNSGPRPVGFCKHRFGKIPAWQENNINMKAANYPSILANRSLRPKIIFNGAQPIFFIALYRSILY